MNHPHLRPPVATCTLAPDGLSFPLHATGSILDAALAAGAAVPFSCMRGECGSCRAQVLDGRFERIAPPSAAAYQTAGDELLMCQCRATSDLLHLRFAHWQAPARPPARHAATVVVREALTPSVTRLVLELAPGDQPQPPFSCQPGQHVHLLMDNGEARPFSIASVQPAQEDGAVRLEFHIRHIPGGAFTGRLLPALGPGDVLQVHGPHGACVWQPPAQPGGTLVLLATGTGFAGVSAILDAVLASGSNNMFGTVHLYWGGRGIGDCYAADRLDALQAAHPGFGWTPVLSGKPDALVQHVQDAALAAGHGWAHGATTVYACGNPAMVRDARAVLTAAGLPAECFHSEAFVPAAPGTHVHTAPHAVRHPWEKVGATFTMDGILTARRRSMDALARIAALMEPGITTAEAIALADAQLRAMGSACNWHPTYVRFGADTQCTSRQPVDRKRRLRADDVFTIDLGPVWDGYEGDYGDTFVLGADPHHQRCAQAARDVFCQTRQAWVAGLSGQALYDFAEVRARTHGCTLVRETAGHRVADFPHVLYGRHRLAEVDFVPDEGVWVLEVQVRDLERPMGAFFEDVLLRSGCFD